MERLVENLLETQQGFLVSSQGQLGLATIELRHSLPLAVPILHRCAWKSRKAGERPRNRTGSCAARLHDIGK